MKKFLYLSMAALMTLMVVSCEKIVTSSGMIKRLPNDRIPVPEAVDIGLEVNGHKVLWASHNLGAGSEEGFGYYYAWGETKPKANYSRMSYMYKKNPDVLPLDRDPAHVVLGGKWRTPTMEEFYALRALKDNPDYTWNPDASMEDAVTHQPIKGLLITQNATHKSVFFPCAAYAEEKEIIKGNFGYYLSSTLETEDQDSFFVFYVPEGKEDLWYWRYCGYPVRPVWVE